METCKCKQWHIFRLLNEVWMVYWWMDGWMYFSTDATIFKPTCLFDIRIWIRIRTQVRKASGVGRLSFDDLSQRNLPQQNRSPDINESIKMSLVFSVFVLVLCLSLNLCFYFSHSSKKIYNIFFCSPLSQVHVIKT